MILKKNKTFFIIHNPFCWLRRWLLWHKTLMVVRHPHQGPPHELNQIVRVAAGRGQGESEAEVGRWGQM